VPLRRRFVGPAAFVGCLGPAVLTFAVILILAYGCSAVTT
jgi:hypothetical protein